MTDGLKIAIGGAVTVVLALLVHLLLGRGDAFMEQLKARTAVALAAGDARGITIRFPTSPLSRTALLSGDVPMAEQVRALAIARTVSGIDGAHWVSLEAADEPPKMDATAKTAALDAATCQQRIDAALAGRTIHFRLGSAWLAPRSHRIIDALAAAFKPCRGQLAVAGHADARGSSAVNRAMTLERARRVRDALVAQGVPVERLTLQSYGAARPIDPKRPEDLANRRVTFALATGGA